MRPRHTDSLIGTFLRTRAKVQRPLSLILFILTTKVQQYNRISSGIVFPHCLTNCINFVPCIDSKESAGNFLKENLQQKSQNLKFATTQIASEPKWHAICSEKYEIRTCLQNFIQIITAGESNGLFEKNASKFSVTTSPKPTIDSGVTTA